ncbi:MAG: hypothetical protein ACPKPY_09045 [Nitrososphaeraceae archaeon]
MSNDIKQINQDKKCINCNEFLNNGRIYNHSLFCSGECKDAHLRKLDTENEK